MSKKTTLVKISGNYFRISCRLFLGKELGCSVKTFGNYFQFNCRLFVNKGLGYFELKKS